MRLFGILDLDHADRALGRRRRPFGIAARQMRADLARQAGRRAIEIADDLAAHVQPGIIVDSVRRIDHAAPDEHHLARPTEIGFEEAGRGQIIAAEGQRRPPGGGQAPLPRRAGGGGERHALQIGAVVARRLQAGGAHLLGDIGGGTIIFGRTGRPALHVVGCQERDMRPHRRLFRGQGRGLGERARGCQQQCKRKKAHENPQSRHPNSSSRRRPGSTVPHNRTLRRLRNLGFRPSPG